jgi:hypothetical protein
MLNAIETDLGASPILQLRTGAAPATVGAADTGTLVAQINIQSDAFASAASWAIALQGVLQDLTADNAGNLEGGHWRLKTSGAVTKIQGTITSTATGTGEMLVDNTNVVAGQQIDVTSFSIGFPTADRG